MVVTRTGAESSDRLLPDRVEATLRRWFVQFSGVFILFGAIAGWICLATWSVKDPSLNNATSDVAKNFLGSWGAALSDMLFQTIGLAAIFFFVPIFAWGWYCISYRFPRFVVLRLSVWPFAIFCLAGAFSYFQKVGAWPLPNGLGGMLGDALIRKIPPLLSLVYLPASVKLSAAILLLMGIFLLFAAISVRVRDFLRLFVVEDIGFKSLIVGLAGWIINLGFEFRSMLSAIAYKYEVARTSRQQSYIRSHSFAKRRERVDPVFSYSDEEDEEEQRNVKGRQVVEEELEEYPRVSMERDGRYEYAEEEKTFDLDEPLAAYADKDTRPDLAQAIRNKFRRKQEKEEKTRAKAKAMLRQGRQKTQKPLNMKQFVLPNFRLLNKPEPKDDAAYLTKEILTENAHLLQEVLSDFGVLGAVDNVHAGPVVTLYEFEPARGTKSSRVISLANDIARSMCAVSARVSDIPKRNAIGIELPNEIRETVYLRSILETDAFTRSDADLPLVLGKTIGGEAVIADLASMPHLLIAGTTGSGKSVGINAMILSLLFKLPPDQCKFIMIDPKMLELSVYDGIPHLLSPVVTDPKKAVAALKWVVQEMEERYKMMSKINVRNISGYNARVDRAKKTGEKLSRIVQTGFDHDTGEAIYEHEEMDFETLPYIVVVIDEMADLMMVAGKEIEAAVQRLSQMARAAGIHLIMATQRPSANVITGVIKTNFPTRVSYQVSSKVDSRIILDEIGAEQLLGAGDMLYSANGVQAALRVHGPFVTDAEIETVVEMLAAQGVPEYLAEVTEIKDEEEASSGTKGGSGDQLYDKAVDIVLRDQKVSISYVQRRLSVGYNKAATLIERMEEEGLISPPNKSGKRQILVN